MTAKLPCDLRTAEEIVCLLSEREQDAILASWGQGMTRQQQARAYADNPKWDWFGLVVWEKSPDLYTVTTLGREVFDRIKALHDVQRRLT